MLVPAHRPPPHVASGAGVAVLALGVWPWAGLSSAALARWHTLAQSGLRPWTAVGAAGGAPPGLPLDLVGAALFRAAPGAWATLVLLVGALAVRALARTWWGTDGLVAAALYTLALAPVAVAGDGLLGLAVAVLPLQAVTLAAALRAPGLARVAVAGTTWAVLLSLPDRAAGWSLLVAAALLAPAVREDGMRLPVAVAVAGVATTLAAGPLALRLTLGSTGMEPAPPLPAAALLLAGWGAAVARRRRAPLVVPTVLVLAGLGPASATPVALLGLALLAEPIRAWRPSPHVVTGLTRLVALLTRRAAGVRGPGGTRRAALQRGA